MPSRDDPSHIDRPASGAPQSAGPALSSAPGGSSSAPPASGTETPTSADAPATAAAPWLDAPGTKIGAYKILHLLGEGGFGSVYLAEQEKPVRRSVALKIIKLGMDTKQVVARFELERQALAVLDHPGIAKVFDAGATESGRPYFAMEFCAGQPIDAFCDQGALTVRARLELFASVADAVQHAHARGIIHRDLKPGNVLVATRDGAARATIIDFGIAKAIASKLTDRTLYTEARQLIGTPEYMAPEQAEGAMDLDIRADVYSLGVLLYKLLTGTTPFTGTDLRSASHAEVQRLIREVDPPKPSTRVTRSAEALAKAAARRKAEPARLASMLRGELDWIVMKALEKDRARRYETVSALAQDVRRHLAGEPVAAAPPSAAYRARVFVRRHKAGVVAGGLVAAALVLGVVGTSVGLADANRQRRLAESRLAEAEAAVKFLDDMLAAADPGAMGKDVTVRAVLEKAEQGIGAEFKDRPLVAARLHETVARTRLSLGDYDAAEPHAKQAHDILRRTLGPDHAQTRRALVGVAAIIVKKAQFAEAEAMLTTALAEHERLFGRAHEITTATIDVLSQLYTAMGRASDATPLAKELVDVRGKTLGKEHLDTLSAMNTLALLYADQEKFEEAEKLYEEALAIQDRVGGMDHPRTLDLRANLAWTLYSVAMARKDTEPDKHAPRLARARTLNEATLEARTRVLGPDHPETMTVMNNLAAVYKELEMWEEADDLSRRGLEVSVRTLGENHPDTIVSLANMGGGLRSRKRYDEAIVYLDRALKAARVSHPPDFQGTAFILGWYGSSLRGLGRFAEGEPMLLEARGIIARTMGEEHGIAQKMALDLQRLYDAWDKAEPGKGYDAKAAEWGMKAGSEGKK